MDRQCYALIQTTLGRGTTRQFPIHRVVSYQTETALDNDADSFSIAIGDPHCELMFLTDRDVEAKVTIYLSTFQGKNVPIFTGLVDDIAFSSQDYMHTLSGRDMSCLAVDSDAPVGKWRHVKPKPFIIQRARKVGITDTQVSSMREIGTLYTDASETEWQFWYRIARDRGMFIWTGPLGKLYIQHLNDSDKARYLFGQAGPGDQREWEMPEAVAVHTRKQRKAEVWVYSEDQKTGRPFYAKSVDTTIKNWKRKPLSLVTTSKAKSNKEAREEADEEVYESIVGAYELQVVIHDHGQMVYQNEMARLRLPEPLDHLNGFYFVVGVTRIGGLDGMTQIVRLRQKDFAVSKRTPDAPMKQPNDPAKNKLASDISGVLSGATTTDGRPLPWVEAFQAAAREFGSNLGWDYATFLATLLAICEHETNFRNVRGTVAGYRNDYAWQPLDVFAKDERNSYGGGEDIPGGEAARAAAAMPGTNVKKLYAETFANAQHNPLNPRYPNSETAVGPMQLVTPEFKVWADEYGWLGRPKKGELDGGRWNPPSNIRAGARAFAAKLARPPAARPDHPGDLRIGLERYLGHPDSDTNRAYADAIMAAVNQQWLPVAQAAVGAAQSLPPGTQTKIETPSGVVIEAPSNTPDVIKKAINFCLQRLGDPYEWAGGGPYYDCSSLVTAAYAAASPELRDELDEPVNGAHGNDTTVTLFRRGRFPAPSRDSILAGDLLFYNGDPPGHVGMYLGGGRMVHDPGTGGYVEVQSITTPHREDNWSGARRLVDWSTAKSTPAASTKSVGKPVIQGPDFIGPIRPRVVMIQAGHDSGDHGDQPYGHTGESGASGELAFTREIRDRVIAHFDSDSRFLPKKGDAWSASAGATASAADDIDFEGDLFVSIHYDIGTAGSGFSFGYTRGATDGRPASMSENSAKLVEAIAVEMIKAGAPSRNADNVAETLWGYYAWGSILRASPDDVNHCPGVTAAVIMECGQASDASFLTNKRKEIAKAIYVGICRFYGFKPV